MRSPYLPKPFERQAPLLAMERTFRARRLEAVPTDCRIVAAANRPLALDVAAGRFREDLFYRLNVVPMVMPPLRERREDIPRLAPYFLERACRRYDLSSLKFPAAVMKRLVDHPWPGNLRELENVIERLVLLAEGERIQAADLPQEVLQPLHESCTFRLPAGGMRWEDHERDCLRQALDLAGGNRARAARLLELPYKAFLYRLEKHQLGPDGVRED